MSSIRYEYDHLNGGDEPPTKCFIQATTNEHGSTAYILTERPDNEGRNVASIASQVGDAFIDMELAKDPSYKPESFRFYAERPERGEDGEPRFAELDAKTTKLENISETDNEYKLKADEWQWKDGNRFDRGELEEQLGAEVVLPERRFQDKSFEQQNQEFMEASFSFARPDVEKEQHADMARQAEPEPTQSYSQEQEQYHDR